MFHNYNEAALKCILYAQEEATHAEKLSIGAFDLVIGILHQVNEPLPIFLKRNFNLTIRKVDMLLAPVKLNKALVRLFRIRTTGFEAFPAIVTKFTPTSQWVLQSAEEERKRFGHQKVGLEHIFLGLLRQRVSKFINFLQMLKVDVVALKKNLFDMMENIPAVDLEISPTKLIEINLKHFEQLIGELNSPLTYLSDNYTKSAYAENFTHIKGRQNEVDQILEILLKKNNNCPILIGPKGVGKKSIIKRLAHQMAKGDVSESLMGKIILKPDFDRLLSYSRTRGEYEGKLRSYLSDSRIDSNILLYLPNIEKLIGTESSSYEGLLSNMSTASVLRTILLNPEFNFIGSTTKKSFTKYIQADLEFRNSVRPIYINELSVKITYEILKTLKQPYQAFHLVEFSPSSIMTAIEYSNKGINNTYFPTKVLEILDETAAYVRFKKSKTPIALKKLIDEKLYITNILQNHYQNNVFDVVKISVLKKKLQLLTSRIRVLKSLYYKQQKQEVEALDWVTDSDVLEVISRSPDAPILKPKFENASKLLDMEETIHTKIIGQEAAVESVARAIRRARVSLRGGKRPIASFIFAGPTGVGKTELTKVLSEYMFDNSQNMLRLDMSEYMEKHTIAKLIGSPPGYIGHNEGGQLTEAIRSKPYSVILFDEVEKAHPEVFNLLLQLLDDGRLTDSQGQIVSFVNTVIVLTTNLGAKETDLQTIKERNLNEKQIDGLVKKQLRKFFKPEFLNRIDEIIVFQSLKYEEICKICYLMVKDLQKSLTERNIILELDDAAYTFLSKNGFDPVYGARPLRRSITKHLIDPLSTLFLQTNNAQDKSIKVTHRLDAKKLNFQMDDIFPEETTSNEDIVFKINKQFFNKFFEKFKIEKKSNSIKVKKIPTVIKVLILMRSVLKISRFEREILITFFNKNNLNLKNQLIMEEYIDYYNY
uniref:Clp protease ATP binding subunit n=1 Tax=Nitzschia sp. (in: diatoms) TaxID=1884248 RepID=A0A5J6DUV5_9STRA|nr:Clp protease ATP binding subunit [Nitzschia sp. (in: diatoms)]QES95314.1 Clp protease ATP binding subunit [Nitzschia sp. (in: diatoms)]